MEGIRKGNAGRTGERGSAMLAAIVALSVLMGLSGAIMALILSGKRETRSSEEGLKAMYLAESGISHAISNMVAGDMKNLGTAGAPQAFSNGSYWVQIADNLNDTYTLTARATYDSGRGAIEAVVRPQVAKLFQTAIFAGNSSGDPAYVMPFGGKGSSGDVINGDIYSGGNIEVKDNAQMNGTLRALGTITGAPGQTGILQPLPNIAGMNYATSNDFDVAAMFASATYQSSPPGGSAWEMPESSPAHIFRMDPSDRGVYTNATAKHDYFLEDPYENVNLDKNLNGSNATHITLSGVGSKPGVSGNEAVYYIDGNLWIHNLNTHSFKFYLPQNPGFHVTFVVKGNIYLADNLFYLNQDKDGVAFIAMNDPAEPDSGNVYLGDPSDGTLKRIDGFLYAENDFYDNNLSQTGSRDVTLNGNMTAGDQVLIDRDFQGMHSKLTVNHDDRLIAGTLNLPGLPSQGGKNTGYTVLSWRRLPIN
jgi:hypothetical protein